jgi:hypothetical protein
MRNRVSGLVLAVILGAGAVLSAAGQAPESVGVTVNRDGAAAAKVAIEFRLLNGGKVSAGATNTAGTLGVPMSLINGGKPVRLQVVIYDCPADQSIVVFVENGAEMPENRECKRTIAGWFWFGRGRLVAVDIARGTVQAQGQSFLSTTRGRLIAGGGAAVLGVGLLSAGGDSSSGNNQTPSGGQNTTFDPNGNYGVTNAVGSDPAEHRFFILMENNTLLTVTITGTSVRITCPPGSKWTQLNGTFTPATGQIAAEGRGPAAGFSNVLFRFSGTIAMSGSNRGAINGTLTIGPNGELNGGPPITYNVTGTKQ